MVGKQYKAGFVAVMGKPNVGKSTLVNTMVGQKIAAVTPRPQTTRKRQIGIVSANDYQVIFVDTPGVHHPRYKLGDFMNKEATKTLEESDIILILVDATQMPDDEDKLLAEILNKARIRTPMVLAQNKADLLSNTESEIIQKYKDLFPLAESYLISALHHQGVDQLLNAIVEKLPPGDPFFSEDQITDLYEREAAADLIREAALIQLRDEVPHGIAVRIDQFTEREDTGAYIEATILVEKESHKPIVIGQKGETLKRIGTAARKEIEAMSGRKIFLRIQVKVRKNWRNDEKIIRRFY